MDWNEGSAFSSAWAEKMRYEQAQAQCGQAVQGIGGQTTNQQPFSRRPSLREEAEKQVGYHREQADKSDRAIAFFREHPEFDEFIQLIRAGVIGI